MSERICTMADCSKRVVGRNLCRTHYQRWWKYGDPGSTKRIRGDERARFWSKVDAEGPCWEWTASTVNGYGTFRLDNRGKTVKAHRYAWETLVGPIPDGAEIDHLCRNTCCVNPDHLEPVTHAENMRRSPATKIAARKQLARTQCANGHEFDETNTHINPQGHRCCRACNRENARNWRLAGADTRNPGVSDLRS